MALKIEDWKTDGYERVTYGEDAEAGLKAIVAIHNTTLGPSCGGIRLLPYATREEGLRDVLRLSKGMSYKSALAGIGFGGGKAVMFADPAKKSAEMMRAMGEFIDKLGGRYIAAKDMNVSSQDLLHVKERTKHVLGIEGVPGSSGDPSPVTARGLFRALEATVEHVTGSRNLAGMRVAIQGVGHVGYAYAEMLHEVGAKLWVSDIDADAVKKASSKLGATAVALEDIYDAGCDIFSPCARGAILNSKTIPRLQCRAVVGAANNQLAEPEDGFRLHERGILYAPDYAVNSGGIINIFIEYERGKYDEKAALKKTDNIYTAMKEIFRRAQDQARPAVLVADELAEERLAHAR